MKVNTVTIPKIDGKKLYYVQISNGFTTVNINIGETNYNALNELIKQEENSTNKVS